MIYLVSVRERYQLSGEEDENQNTCNDASSQVQIYRKQLKFEIFLSKDWYFCTEKSYTIFFSFSSCLEPVCAFTLFSILSVTRTTKLEISHIFLLKFSAACWCDLVLILEGTMNCSKQTFLSELFRSPSLLYLRIFFQI